MSNRERLSNNIVVTVEGIGGIDSTEVTLDHGVTLLAGRNATNRTSLLQAIMAALGSTEATLKGDRKEGRVELEIDGQQYTRVLERTESGIQFSGDPYLSDPTEADLFAFLLESNEVRKSVTNDRNIRDVIMRPVDTTEIERQISQLQEKRDEINSSIAELESERERLPELETKRSEIAEELTAKRERLAEARTELDAADADIEKRQEQKQQLEETLTELGNKRSEREKIQYRIETEREALESAMEELESVEETLTELPAATDSRLRELSTEIDQFRERKRASDRRLSKLNQITQFNEEMLDSDGAVEALFDDDEGAVTDALAGESKTTCWTCGSTVELDEVETMLGQIRELRQTEREQRSNLERELSDLTDEREELEAIQEQQEELDTRKGRLRSDVERHEETIERLASEQRKITAQIEEIEGKAERLESVTDSQLLDRHKTVNERELAVERLEEELESVTASIEQLESYAEEITELTDRREQLREQLTELRTRIERLETEAIEAFNEHMDALVELLQYDNLARVWIERTTTGSGETEFILHIVRTTGDGASYEDELAHLSESEREVVGLVLALAGYLVHDVYETVPFLLLDSLEAIDAERIALLIEYLAEYAPTIVAALLREDTQQLDDSYPRLSEI